MSAITLHARPSSEFSARLEEARTALALAAAKYQPLTQASSLGAEDVVITHLIQTMALDVSVFVLQTGMLHEQTLALLKRSMAADPGRFRVFEPQAQAVVTFVEREGRDAMYRSIDLRKACCHIRKMEPLERALAGHPAWITGLRREQSQTRAEVALVEAPDVVGGRAKINPLANWTWGDVWHYIDVHGVAYNPLHDEFFPSIGCAPCTRAISLGEDFRAGRWWWENDALKECGLHVGREHEVQGTPA